MQHKALFRFAFERLNWLRHVIRGAKRGGDQRLRFAAGKDGGAVRAGKKSGFNPDGANFIKRAAIRTALVSNHLLAGDLLAQFFVIALKLFLSLLAVFRNRFQQLFLDFADQVVAFRLRMFLGYQAASVSSLPMRFFKSLK